MNEIEVKVIGFPKEKLLAKLEEVKAIFDCVEYQTNYLIDSSVKPLDPMKYMRIRETKVDEDLKTEFTIKKRRENQQARVNEELTVHIDDTETLIYMLKELGYDQLQRFNKVRSRYLLQGARVELDEWEKDVLSYPYFEIEAESVERLQEVITILEIPQQCISTKSIGELRAEDTNRG